MKANELINKTAQELQRQIVELQQEWQTLLFKVATRQAKQTHRMQEVRKDIARIQTVLSRQATK